RILCDLQPIPVDDETATAASQRTSPVPFGTGRNPDTTPLQVLRPSSVGEPIFQQDLMLRLRSDAAALSVELPLSPEIALEAASLRRVPRAGHRMSPVHFVGTESLDRRRLAQLWDAISLTPDE